jgi:hypothetical protein
VTLKNKVMEEEGQKELEETWLMTKQKRWMEKETS